MVDDTFHTENANSISGRARLDHLGRLKLHLFCMVVKYFLSVRTGIRAHQVDTGDFNRAGPLREQIILCLIWTALKIIMGVFTEEKETFSDLF